MPEPGLFLRDGQVQRVMHGRGAVIGPAVPLRHAADSLRRARELRACPPEEHRGGPVDGGRCLPELLLLGDPVLVRLIADRRLRPLSALTPKRGERLAATLPAWLRTNRGSAPDVAARLGIHPQTARRRLHQVQRLFGPALGDADAGFELEVALRSRLMTGAPRAARVTAGPAPRRAVPGGPRGPLRRRPGSDVRDVHAGVSGQSDGKRMRRVPLCHRGPIKSFRHGLLLLVPTPPQWRLLVSGVRDSCGTAGTAPGVRHGPDTGGRRPGRRGPRAGACRGPTWAGPTWAGPTGTRSRTRPRLPGPRLPGRRPRLPGPGATRRARPRLQKSGTLHTQPAARLHGPRPRLLRHRLPRCHYAVPDHPVPVPRGPGAMRTPARARPPS